ncbi:MAG: heme transporter HemC, partial [Candidatus Puniceispirillum sp.]
MFDFLANPTRFMRIADWLFRPLLLVTTVTMAYGLYLGLFASPPDYQQGETVRIIYIHVPAAWLAL